MRGQQWAPFAAAGAALVLVAAVPVARAVLSDDPPPAAADLRAEPTASESPSPTATPSESPSPLVTAPAPVSASPSPAAKATSSRPQPSRTASATPKAMSGDEYEAWYCRTAKKTTGAVTLTLQYCRWPGARNDAYTLTMAYTGDRVVRAFDVERGDGTVDKNTWTFHNCVDDDRPRTMHHGAEIHELPTGSRTIVGTVTAHRCGDPYADPPGSGDPDYEDTDHPETATVTLVMPEIAEP